MSTGGAPTAPGELAPLPVGPRAARVRARLGDLPGGGAAEALLVTDLTNLRWTTGFSGSSAWLLVLPDRLVLVTDGRYVEQARAELAALDVGADVAEARTEAEMIDRVADLTRSVTTLAFEAERLSVAVHGRLAAAVAPHLVPASGLVEAERRTKDDAEVARIAEAARITDAALAAVVPMLGERPLEVDVRDELEHRMRRLGAAGPSFETIVATGPANASLPHHRPDRTVVEEGHTVIVDVGALVEGYHSDMTRTFVVGEPTPRQREVFDLVLAAQRAGVAALGPGLEVAGLDAICRDLIAEAGWGAAFSHGTGHGVGLQIHEDPFVNSSAKGTLRAGDVVTVEPGVYRGDFGGVRIEDLVVVTSDGHRVLTHSPKDSPCLPSPRTT